jgi:hypothetical protein
MTALKGASQMHLHDLLEVEDATAGMRTIASIKGRLSDKTAAQQAAQHGIETIPLRA